MGRRFVVFVPVVAKWLVVAPSVMVFPVLLLLHVVAKKSVIGFLLRLLWPGSVVVFLYFCFCVA